jgi:hypothetical protein
MKPPPFRALAAGLALAFLPACHTAPALAVFDTRSAAQVRSFQSHAFDTTDRERTLRDVIATLQDCGFVIDRADAALGAITATKLDGYEMRMTVTVRPRGQAQQLVRASAEFKPSQGSAARPVEEAYTYREFFTALEKSKFLTAHQVD